MKTMTPQEAKYQERHHRACLAFSHIKAIYRKLEKEGRAYSYCPEDSAVLVKEYFWIKGFKVRTLESDVCVEVEGKEEV